MKKSEMQTLRQYVGDLDSIFGIKDYTYNDGPARGMRAFDVKNGKGLEMTLAADRGLDIPGLRYKGVNVSFAAKVGLRAPSLYTEDAGRGFLKQFNAGMLTTCGITYAGAACEDGGRKLGLHGNYDNTPPPRWPIRRFTRATKPSCACAARCARPACSRRTCCSPARCAYTRKRTSIR